MGLFKRKKDDKKDEKQPKCAEVKDAEKKKSPSLDKSGAETGVKMKDLYDEEGKAKKDFEGEKIIKKGKSDAKKVVIKKGLGKDAHKILIKPLISEKASGMGVENKYIFVVDVGVNKIMVKKAVEQVYGVKPTQINIINNKGKQVRTGRIQGQRKDWKKAVVTLPKGQSIQIYEGV